MAVAGFFCAICEELSAPETPEIVIDLNYGLPAL